MTFFGLFDPMSVCSVYVNILLQAFQGLLWRSMSMLLSLYSYIFPADVPFLHFTYRFYVFENC